MTSALAPVIPITTRADAARAMLSEDAAHAEHLNATIATPPGAVECTEWQVEEDGRFTRMAFGPTYTVAIGQIGSDVTQDEDGNISNAHLYFDVKHDEALPVTEADAIAAAIEAAKADVARMMA